MRKLSKYGKPTLLEQDDFVRMLRAHGLAVGRAVQARLRQYPRFYALRVAFGYGLFAAEGRHRGSGFGAFYWPVFELYGAKQFERWGGLAWQKGVRERVECRKRRGGEHGNC